MSTHRPTKIAKQSPIFADRSAYRRLDTDGWRPWALTGGIRREQQVPRPVSSGLLPRKKLRSIGYVRNVIYPHRCPRPALIERQSRRRACVCGRLKNGIRPVSLLLALAKQPILLLLAALDLASRAEVAELAIGTALTPARVVVPCAGLAVMWVEVGALAVGRRTECLTADLVDINRHTLDHLFLLRSERRSHGQRQVAGVLLLELRRGAALHRTSGRTRRRRHVRELDERVLDRELQVLRTPVQRVVQAAHPWRAPCRNQRCCRLLGRRNRRVLAPATEAARGLRDRKRTLSGIADGVTSDSGSHWHRRTNSRHGCLRSAKQARPHSLE